MALCFVVFNPAQSKRLMMNYLYVANLYRSFGLPVYTMELVFEGRDPEIPTSPTVFHVHGNSHMFHKERLCRLLEQRVPRRFTKLAFLDADVIFDHTGWYDETSALLDTHDVVQPFEKAHWMDLSYTEIELTRETVLKMNGPVWDFKYHPGFAWAFRREWYRKYGFFDWAVSGSGDTLSTSQWMSKTFPRNFKSLPAALRYVYKEYAQHPVPRITYRPGDIYHLYHGSRKNRQYSERHQLLEVSQHIEQMIEINKDGVYEWVDPKWNGVFLDYFKNRFDDDA
jgi:hypothetical protein